MRSRLRGVEPAPPFARGPRRGGIFDDRVAGPDHVSVFIPDRARWDAWYNAEKVNASQNPFVPNSEETRLLYSLREVIP